MKILLAVIGAASLVAAVTNIPSANAASPTYPSGPTSPTIVTRIRTLEEGGATNRIKQFATNSTTAILDMNAGSSWMSVTSLSANCTFYISNAVVGKSMKLFVQTDGSARTVTIATNGSSGLRVVWDALSTTNGTPSFTCTNFATVTLDVLPRGIIRARHQLTL